VSRWLGGLALQASAPERDQEGISTEEQRCYRLWEVWAITHRAVLGELEPSASLEHLSAYLPTPLAEAAFELTSIVSTRPAIEQWDAAVRLAESVVIYYLAVLEVAPRNALNDGDAPQDEHTPTKHLTFRQLVRLLREQVNPSAAIPEECEQEPSGRVACALSAIDALEELCDLRDELFYGGRDDAEAAAAAVRGVAALVRGLVELDLAPLFCVVGLRARVFAGLAPRHRCLDARVEGIGFCGIDELLRGGVILAKEPISGDRWLIREGDDLRLCRMEHVKGRWAPAPEDPLPEDSADPGDECLRVPLPLDAAFLEFELDGGLPMLHRAVQRYDRAERILCALVASEDGFALEGVENDARSVGSLLSSAASGRVVALLRQHGTLLGELRDIRNILHHALRSPRGSPRQLAAFVRRLHSVAEGLGWGQWRWCTGGVDLPGVGPLSLRSHWVLKNPAGGALVYDARAGSYRDSANRPHPTKVVAHKVGQPASEWIRETFKPVEAASTAAIVLPLTREARKDH
jgi:hypothetical protein